MQQLKTTLSDGRTELVTTTLLDKVAAETYFRSNPRFGKAGDNPFRLTGLLAFSALKRTGKIAVEWDQFLEARDPDQLHVVDVEAVDAQADEEADGVGEDTSADPHTS